MSDEFNDLALKFFKLYGNTYRTKFELAAIYEFSTWLNDFVPVMQEYKYWRYEPNKPPDRPKSSNVIDGIKKFNSRRINAF